MSDFEDDDDIFEEEIIEPNSEDTDDANEDSEVDPYDEEEEDDEQKVEKKIDIPVDETTITNVEFIRVIEEENYRTPDNLSLFEFVECVGMRAAMIMRDPSLILIEVTDPNKGPIDIAMDEIIQKLIPLQVKRNISPNEYEIRSIKTLGIPPNFRYGDIELRNKINKAFIANQSK